MSAEPLRTTTFILTSADALAYEQATARFGTLGTLALICWLGLCGAAALLIPPDWAGPHLSWTFDFIVAVLIAIGGVIALLLMAFRQWQRARKRLRRPIELQLEEWPDRLELSGSGLPRTVTYVDIRRVLLTRTHLLLETDGEPVILPRRGFPEEGSIETLAARIEKAPRPATVDPTPASA
jgi:hypothetical protein